MSDMYQRNCLPAFQSKYLVKKFHANYGTSKATKFIDDIQENVVLFLVNLLYEI